MMPEASFAHGGAGGFPLGTGGGGGKKEQGLDLKPERKWQAVPAHLVKTLQNAELHRLLGERL